MGIFELVKKMRGFKNSLFGEDFLLTWEKSLEEIEQVLIIAEVLKGFHSQNISPRCFNSGLAVSLFRDQSTRTRFSYASAANLLGLVVADLDEEKSQVGHGETVRETAVMISFLAKIIGIRDDKFLGLGDTYMREVSAALKDAYKENILDQKPPVINLQSDLDHPTQSLADLLHIKQHFGSLDKLKGKKIAMTWAYSPSYGKPLSVPQGIVGLMTRLGMEVILAHPEGYDLIPEIVSLSAKNAEMSSGSFKVVNDIWSAFENADIVYPKSWAPFQVMKKRTELLKVFDHRGLIDLEKDTLLQNARYKDWECTADLMKTTAKGNALYMHCLPADISGVSCEKGEVTPEVFNKYRKELYNEAGYKPYIISAMMLASLVQNPAGVLSEMIKRALPIREY